MRFRYLSLVLLLIIFTNSGRISAIPSIDGDIKTNEWSDGFLYHIPMTNGAVLNLTIIYTESDIYMLIVMPHNSPGDKIQLLADNYTYHDYLGVEFDNNKDDAIMGTYASPDDTIIVDYEVEGGTDMYMHSFRAFTDEESHGTNDVTGNSGSFDGNLVFEIKKPLITNDANGHDISLEKGDKFLIMFAFWDDALAHAATTYINQRIGNNQFIEFRVGYVSSDTTRDYITIGVFALAGIITFIVYYFDISKESFRKIIQRFSRN